MLEVVGIISRAAERKSKDIDVRMVATCYAVTLWSQERWVVVRALASPWRWAVQMTTVLATMSDHAIPADKTWAISCCEKEVEVGLKYTIFGCIPDAEAFTLKCCDVVEAYE